MLHSFTVHLLNSKMLYMCIHLAGGGTTDVAVVEVAAGAAPRLLSTWGNPFLGGHDIKHKLLDIWATDNQAAGQLVTTPQAAKGVLVIVLQCSRHAHNLHARL